MKKSIIFFSLLLACFHHLYSFIPSSTIDKYVQRAINLAKKEVKISFRKGFRIRRRVYCSDSDITTAAVIVGYIKRKRLL